MTAWEQELRWIQRLPCPTLLATYAAAVERLGPLPSGWGLRWRLTVHVRRHQLETSSPAHAGALRIVSSRPAHRKTRVRDEAPSWRPSTASARTG